MKKQIFPSNPIQANDQKMAYNWLIAAITNSNDCAHFKPSSTAATNRLCFSYLKNDLGQFRSFWTPEEADFASKKQSIAPSHQSKPAIFLTWHSSGQIANLKSASPGILSSTPEVKSACSFTPEMKSSDTSGVKLFLKKKLAEIYKTMSNRLKMTRVTRSNLVSTPNLARTTAGLFGESQIEKQNGNNEKTVANDNFGVQISPINHNASLSNLTAINNENIPQAMFAVKRNNLAGVSPDKKLGRIITEPNKAADKSVNSPDKTLAQDFENDRFIRVTRTDLVSI